MFFISLLAVGVAFGGQGDGVLPPVVIGVVDSSGAFGGLMAAGAQSAAREVNDAGGINGRPLVLMRMEDSNPWKGGARLMARLASEPGLVAVVGAQDGTSAHVLAQVTTRRRIPAIVFSPEESLTQANDPWLFRGVPDDEEQARILLNWAAAKGKRAALVVPEGREGRERQRSLEKACKESGVTVAAAIRFGAGAMTPPKECEILLLWLDPLAARRWFEGPGKSWRPQKMLASLRLDSRAFLGSAPAEAEGLAMPLLQGSTGAPRDVLEGAAYDAVMAIVSAVRLKGTRPGDVREGLARGGPWRGRSGFFRFDSQGNRLGDFSVGVLREGRLVKAEPKN